MSSRLRLSVLLGAGLLLVVLVIPTSSLQSPHHSAAESSPAPQHTSEPLRVHCVWHDPETGQRRVVSFADQPLLAVIPGDKVRVRITRGDTAVSITRVTAEETKYEGHHRLLNSREALLVPPNATGPHFVRLKTDSQDFRICLFVPFTPALSKESYGYLSLGSETLGYYRDPTRSGADKVKDNPDSYAPPRHFLRIDKTTGDFLVSPSLRLVDMVVPSEKTGNRHTDYIPVRYALLDMIEILRMALASQGINGAALTPISLFRTPRYNRSIGSGRFSRHIYGDALDFIIDADGNGRMDDLTGDGKTDRDDALWLVALIEDLQADQHIPIGGIGVYTFATGDHTVTMHLDLRGHRARWAYHHDTRGRKREFEWISRRFAEQDAEEKRLREERARQEKK